MRFEQAIVGIGLLSVMGLPISVEASGLDVHHAETDRAI
jgi:hypothetical protein